MKDLAPAKIRRKPERGAKMKEDGVYVMKRERNLRFLISHLGHKGMGWVCEARQLDRKGIDILRAKVEGCRGMFEALEQCIAKMNNPGA